MSNERVTLRENRALTIEKEIVHAKARHFIEVNGLKKRLNIGTRIPEGTMLEDSLAIEIAAEQMGILRSDILRLRSSGLSKRRILGAYSRYKIRELEKKRYAFILVYEYLIEERKLHRDEICRTPQQLESAGVIMKAIDDLVTIAEERKVSLGSGKKLTDLDLESWQEEYSERIFNVS